MSHVFQISDDIYAEIAAYAAQRGQNPDTLLTRLVIEGVELLKRIDSTMPTSDPSLNPAHDPLAPFIGAFDSGDDSGWIEEHDAYFAGEHREINGNKE
jgi:hypothetical protein